MKSKGESQRIYWQQWLSAKSSGQQQHSQSNSNSNSSSNSTSSRRELITSSAAIRISPDAAKAKDVTKLLRDTLNLSSLNSEPDPQDSLVLVGSLYSLPRDYVQFENEARQVRPQQPHQPHQGQTSKGDCSSTAATAYPSIRLSSSSDPFHVVKTLRPDDNPLAVRDLMMEHLRKILHDHQTTTTSASTSTSSACQQQQQQQHNNTNGGGDSDGERNNASIATSTSISNSNSYSNSNTIPTIAPKAQWYFVPSGGDPAKSLIPNCIELDGYCTSMEEEDYEESDDDDDDGCGYGYGYDYGDDEPPNLFDNDETDSKGAGANSSSASSACDDMEVLFSRIPFLRQQYTTAAAAVSKQGQGQEQYNAHATITRMGRRTQHKQLRRYTQLSSRHYNNMSCASGYLLKQSQADPHVWRRVYCVLTNDNFWYVTRILSTTSTKSTITRDAFLPRMAKFHGKISLGRALLLEPNTEYTASPLYRIPYAFEVVSSRGTSHVFRATNRGQQRQWIQALSTKILESFENSLLGHAELIVADESIARNKRLQSIAVHPLCQYRRPNGRVCGGGDDKSAKANANIVASVLRLGMDISEYREQCRHVQAILPAKQPVVVVSESPRNQRVVAAAATGTDEKKKQENQPRTTTAAMIVQPEALDAETKQLVQASWDTATRLLARATHVALEVQQTKKQHNSMSRSLETLCRHVDYVITGQHRQLLQDGRFTEKNNGGVRPSTDISNAPPPMDLFDLLLAELQSWVRASQKPTNGDHRT